MPKDVLDPIIATTKIELRKEINKDMQLRINETILQHPSAVNVTQLLKMPDSNKGDKSNEDIVELKIGLTNLKSKTESIEN